MAAIANGIGTPEPSIDLSSPSKSKKRKHDGNMERTSSKKRKQDTAMDSTPNAIHVEADAQGNQTSYGKKSDKKKEKKDKEKHRQAAEDTAANGDEPTVADKSPTTDDVSGNANTIDLSPKKDKKKKMHRKDRDSKHTNDEPLAKPEQSDNATSKTPGEDIDLPDAPPAMTDELSTPTPNDITTGSEHTQIADLLTSAEPSSFHSTRISLHLSLPAIALSTSHARSSILAQHLSPLLLTYFQPANGIVLAFSNPILSGIPSNTPDAPLRLPSDTVAAASEDLNMLDKNDDETTNPKEVLARTADEFGACWAWLTVTFLVFRPDRGEEILGWTNVASDGFVGVVAYNYFQAAIGKDRIPTSWRWSGAEGSQSHRRTRKGRLGDGVLSSQEHSQNTAEDGQLSQQTKVYKPRHDDDMGHFVDTAGDVEKRVPDVLKFRVVDTEMVPGHERGSLSLQIDATLLDKEAEKKILEEEKARWERQQLLRRKGRAETPGSVAGSTNGADGDVAMSGGLG